MVSEATKINRKELGSDWLDSRDAARAIGCTVDHLYNSRLLGAL